VDTRKAIIAGAVLAVVAAITYLAARSSMGPSDPAAMMASKDRVQQQKGVAALAKGLDSPEGIQRIVQAVTHKDPEVASRALRSVVAARTPGKPLPPPIMAAVEKATEDPRIKVKITSIQVLEAVTPAAPEDTRVPELVLKRFQSETAPLARAAAANALGKMLYWPALGPLIQAMEDESLEVRGAAGVAIVKILGTDVNFHAGDPPAKRAAAIAMVKNQARIQTPFHEDYIRRLRDRRRANQ
jgi:HEAT repeat protein